MLNESGTGHVIGLMKSSVRLLNCILAITYTGLAPTISGKRVKPRAEMNRLLTTPLSCLKLQQQIALQQEVHKQ